MATADELTKGVPCGEKVLVHHGEAGAIRYTAEAVSEDAILNAAWLVRQNDFGDLTVVAGESTSGTIDAGVLGAILDGLVLKSLEISELRREQSWEWDLSVPRNCAEHL